MRRWGQSHGGNPARRFGRRTVVRTALAGGAAAAFLAACGGDDNSSSAGSAGGEPAPSGSTAAEGTPKPGGVLREATITQAPHFSPFHPGADPSYVNFFRREWGYYDELWALKDIKDTNKLDLRLATGIEQPDDVTAIVKMQPSTFQNRAPANGRDVTAEDVAAIVEFLRKPPAPTCRARTSRASPRSTRSRCATRGTSHTPSSWKSHLPRSCPGRCWTSRR